MSESVRYLLGYTHEYGTDIKLFDYMPSVERPYPDIRKLVDHFHIDFEPQLNESLLLEQLDGLPVDRLDAQTVGSVVADAPPPTEFYELEEDEDD